jgi:hypothetical protein
MFYAHPQMADGRLNKCIDCTKKDVRERYELVRERRHAYEAARSRTPERKAALAAASRRHKVANPEKTKARNAVSNAIRDGRLLRQPCEVCGQKAQAHHHDYSKPLDVQWLCFKHHRAEHGQETSA